MLSVTRAAIASTVSMWRGTEALHLGKRPQQQLHLYDIEGCPYCKLVREAITELDLDVVIFPCPKGGIRFRNSAIQLGGKEQFPLLVDPNTSITLYESNNIIKYLFSYYGTGSLPKRWRHPYRNITSSFMASLICFGSGMYNKSSNPPSMMLELYSFESNPFCKPVKSLLCELEIPYILHNVARPQWFDYVRPRILETSLRRADVENNTQAKVPFLVDANTGVEIFGSNDICCYLRQQYCV